MFDNLIQEVSGRFGLGPDKARQLVGVLIALIFDDKRGGFGGFSERLQQRGLGHLLQSWSGGNAPQAISPAQVETVFGGPLLGAIAKHLGIGTPATSGAIGALLPGLVRQFASGGSVPARLPDSLKGWVAGLGNWAGGLTGLGWGAAAGSVTAAVGQARAAEQTVGRAANKASCGPGRIVPPLLLLVGVVLAALALLRSCSSTSPKPAPEAQAVAAADPQQRATPYFNLETAAGKAAVHGQVASEQEKQRLATALAATFGAGNVAGDIVVDAATAPAGWLDRLVALLPKLKTDGLKLAVEGDRLEVDTSALPDDQRFALSAQLREAFSGFEVSGLWDKAMAALGALKSGFSADDLVQALNLSSVQFDTGSAVITRDSYETLAKAAEAIKAAPAGTRIEVGGHTDNTGEAAANLALSQARAEAVIARLVELGVPSGALLGKGYGQTAPVADNTTEQGRAQNRRMAFTVLK